MKMWRGLIVLVIIGGGAGEASAYFWEGESFLRCDSRMWHCRWYEDSKIREHTRPIFPRILRDSSPTIAASYASLGYDRIMQKGGLVPSSTTVEYFGCEKIRQTVAGVTYVVGHKCWLLDTEDSRGLSLSRLLSGLSFSLLD